MDNAEITTDDHTARQKPTTTDHTYYSTRAVPAAGSPESITVLLIPR